MKMKSASMALLLALTLLVSSPYAQAAEEADSAPLIRWSSVTPAQAEDSGLLMLVNQSHTIPKDMKPETVQVTEGSTVSLRAEAVQAYSRMYRDMTAQGITGCYITSGYRSYATQEWLLEGRVQKKMQQGMSRSSAYASATWGTAPAGASEHQTGLAMDVTVNGALNGSFANTAAGTWLREHAWAYGFTLRYQQDKRSITRVMDEPWHYRYLGVPHAQILREQGWCYEEYIEALHEAGSLSAQVGDWIYQVCWTADENEVFTNVVDVSGDNAGGWIVTTCRPVDPLSAVRGHWSESAFTALADQGVTFSGFVDPNRAITAGEFAKLCALEPPAADGAAITREDAARLAASNLPEHALCYLRYQDVDQISGAAFQSVQAAVYNGLFDHSETLCFRPADKLTWAEGALLAVRFRALLAGM